MKPFKSLLLTFLTLLLFGSSTPEDAERGTFAISADHVVILDIDGLRRDALYDLLAHEPDSIPNLSRIVLGKSGSISFDGRFGDVSAPVAFEGSQAIGVNLGTSVLPSYTFAGQASLFTGYYPNRHGILGNEYFDRTIPGPGARKRRGFSGGSLVGPVSGFPVQIAHIIGSYEYDAPDLPLGLEDKAITEQVWCQRFCETLTDRARDISTDPSHPMYGGFANRNLLVPTLYEQASRAGKRSLVAFNMYSSAAYHTDGNIRWIRPTRADLCAYQCGNPPGEAFDGRMTGTLVEWLRDVPGEQMPHIVTAYFGGHDHAAHQAERHTCYGEPCQLGYLKNVVDRRIGELVQVLTDRGIYDRTVFVITTDHGHTNLISDDRHAVINEGEMEHVIERYLGNPVCRLLDDCPFDVYDYNDWLSGGDDYGAYYAQNGGIAQVYVRSYDVQRRRRGPWSEPPNVEHLLRIANELDRYVIGGEKPFVDILVRDYGAGGGWSSPYKVYRGGTLVDLDSIEWPADYVEVITRIQSLNHIRSGDILLTANYGDGYYCDSRQWSGHGHLTGTDSLIPIVLAGEPLAGLGRTVAAASQVDVVPTIAQLLGFAVEADGRSFLGK